MGELQTEFFRHLSEKYGEWDVNGARFGTNSYGFIAEDLCISASLFTKLLNGTATDGMYKRTIKNIARLKERERLRSENQSLLERLAELQETLSGLSTANSSRFRILFMLLLGGIFVGYLLKGALTLRQAEVDEERGMQGNALSAFFEGEYNEDYVSPYLSNSEAQDFCPCSAFEGVWNLEKEYVIPVPNKKPGLYYLAKSVDLRVKCLHNAPVDKKGKVFIGFEQLEHELWVDTKQESLAPKYFNPNTKQYTKAFYEIDFEGDPQFQKVATISSYFYNYFELGDRKIVRKGEPVGRFANAINEDLAQTYEVDVKNVLESVIGNLVKTVCDPYMNEYCNPNALRENESVMRFDCDFTIKTENLGIGGSYPYTKGYLLVEQNYSNNLLCTCED